MRYVFVPPEDAESFKRILLETGNLAEGRTLKEHGTIGFPIHTDIEGYETVERYAPVSHKSLRDALTERIGERASEVKRAFDVIGDLAIIETTRGFEDVEAQIADALLEVHRNIASVYVKDGGHEGDYRIQRYRWLAGDERTTTVHRENGYAIELDIATTYFSPRLGGERMRIARLVRDDERVLVLGSGVGPYPVCIEKHANPARIVGVEFNEDAHHWALTNVERNRCTRTECVCADAATYLEREGDFDRIIMPLPAQSLNLLEAAWSRLAPGGTLHVYLFIEESQLDDPPLGTYNERITHAEIVGAAAPGTLRVCFDLTR